MAGRAKQPSPGATAHGIVRWRAAGAEKGDDLLAVEEPLEIRIGDEPLAVTMRTPGHDDELAAGFCLSEGIVTCADEIESIDFCEEAERDNVIVVTLGEDSGRSYTKRIARARRDLYLSSSCGLCGKQTLDRIEQAVARFDDGGAGIDASRIAELPDTMRAHQSNFSQTGGLHAAALFSSAGDLLVLREDVGRHNAVDKAVGHYLLRGRPFQNASVLLVSGRASFEIMQKAAVAGVPVVAAISAPSSMAVDFAERFNMTLIGFLREGRMNIYHDDAARLRV
jgi:FdhD protein